MMRATGLGWFMFRRHFLGCARTERPIARMVTGAVIRANRLESCRNKHSSSRWSVALKWKKQIDKKCRLKSVGNSCSRSAVAQWVRTQRCENCLYTLSRR